MPTPRRRKGRRRPPTVGRNCRWLEFDGGFMCAAGGVCDKRPGCGYEEDLDGEPMVQRLRKKRGKKEDGR